MTDLGLEPHQYRRKAAYRLSDTSWLVKLAGPLGILAPPLAARCCRFFPRTVVGRRGAVLASGIALIVLHEALDGTRIKHATETRDQVPAELGASRGAGTAEDVSRARLPKEHSGRT